MYIFDARLNYLSQQTPQTGKDHTKSSLPTQATESLRLYRGTSRSSHVKDMRYTDELFMTR